MTVIPEMDLTIANIISGKKAVVYSSNEKGEFPNTFDKSFIPSSITLTNNWYIGYTNSIIDGFNMIELTDNELYGLQFFNIIDGDIKKYDKFGRINPDEEKLEIVLLPEETVKQKNSKALLLDLELSKVYTRKIKLLYSSYPEVERDTWNIQYDEAVKYQLDNTASVPFITTLATARGVELSILVTLIISKANFFRDALATLIGEKQKYSDRIVTSIDNIALNTLLTEIDTII